jgi:hypothetical protein
MMVVERPYKFSVFEIIGEIEEIETVAIGGRIRDIMRTQKVLGLISWQNQRKVTGLLFA